MVIAVKDIAEKDFLTSSERSGKEFFSFFDTKDLLTIGKNSTSEGSTSNHFNWHFWRGMVEKQESHWNKKSFEGVFRNQSKVYNGAFLVNS